PPEPEGQYRRRGGAVKGGERKRGQSPVSAGITPGNSRQSSISLGHHADPSPFVTKRDRTRSRVRDELRPGLTPCAHVLRRSLANTEYSHGRIANTAPQPRRSDRGSDESRLARSSNSRASRSIVWCICASAASDSMPPTKRNC